MADVQNVITLGIGSDPGSIKFFLTLGLDIGEELAVVAGLALTADSRSTGLTAASRSTGLTPESRSGALTLTTRPQ